MSRLHRRLARARADNAAIHAVEDPQQSLIAEVIEAEFREFPGPGAIYGMPNAHYQAIDAISASGAKRILKSPRHFYVNREDPEESTDSMEFGIAVHTGVLEPEAYVDRVVLQPPFDMNSSRDRIAAMAFANEHVGKIALSLMDRQRAARTIAATREHEAAARLLAGAKTEVSLFWYDERTGVPCKARLDAMNHGGISDLKTTLDASREAFRRTAEQRMYHVQKHHYCDGFRAVFGRDPEYFAFIAAESQPLHGVACWLLPEWLQKRGRVLLDEAVTRYATSLSTDTWPLYPQTIEVL